MCFTRSDFSHKCLHSMKISPQPKCINEREPYQAKLGLFLEFQPQNKSRINRSKINRCSTYIKSTFDLFFSTDFSVDFYDQIIGWLKKRGNDWFAVEGRLNVDLFFSATFYYYKLERLKLDLSKTDPLEGWWRHSWKEKYMWWRWHSNIIWK